jgi:hypothetical protein
MTTGGSSGGSNEILQKFQALALGEKIILIAGPLLLIASFLPWYKIEYCFLGECASATANGWDDPSGWASMLATIIGLGMAVAVGVVRFANVKLPEMPNGVTWGRIMLGLAIFAAFLIVIKLLDHSSNLSYGFFLGIILVAALIVGGGLLVQEESKGRAA